MRRRRTSGFTLLELVFVVFLIALLSSITLPVISNVLGTNLRRGATEVAGYLRSAYEFSVMRHERVRVRFDIASGRYWAETYQEPETLPLIEADTKLAEALELFEDRLEERELSPEEKLELEQQRYKKVDIGSLKMATLPGNSRFKGVYTVGEERWVEEGVPWVEFTPGGYAQKTLVQITNNREKIYSIILPPLGGRPAVKNEEVSPDDV